MDLGLKDKVAMIVGATRGFGRACATVFAEEGARLALVARNETELKKVAEEARKANDVPMRIWSADLMNPAEPQRVVDEIVEHYGTVNCVVNTVGVTTVDEKNPARAADSYWEEAFQSVLMVAVRVCRAVVPVMQKNGGGAIVNTSAMSARHYLPVIAHYSAQKAAVAHFTKNLAIQYGKDGIRANMILPGWIRSEQVDEMLDLLCGIVKKDADQMLNRGYEVEKPLTGLTRQQAFEKLNAEMHYTTFCGRMGEPIEYARVAAFLCSNAASYVNGAWVNVDGGSMF